MSTKTLTTAQATAVRTAAVYGGEEPPSGSRTAGRYLIDGRPNSLAVLVRLGLAETITDVVGIGREEITQHVLTKAGETIRHELRAGGELPTLGHVAEVVQEAADRAALDGHYEPNEPGAKTLADARPLVILGKPVSVTIEGKGERAYLYVGGTWLYNGPVPSAIRFRHEVNAWAARVAMADPAPWAQVGARVGAGWTHGTVTARRYDPSECRYSIVFEADQDGERYLITADSPRLSRLCALCDTVGDDSLTARESSFGAWLCGFCSHAYSERYLARTIPGRPEDGFGIFDRDAIMWKTIRMTGEEAAVREAELNGKPAPLGAEAIPAPQVDDMRDVIGRLRVRGLGKAAPAFQEATPVHPCETTVEAVLSLLEPTPWVGSTEATPANLGQEEGHNGLCGWPYRPCADFCAHLEGWESHKYESPLAERLHTLSLDSNQDAEVGSADTIGWWALFAADRAILHEIETGYVYADVYSTPEAARTYWAELEAREIWFMVDALDTTCDALFLIIDPARHNGTTPDLDDIRAHIPTCQACHAINSGFMDM
jgi:hypothetical protein